MILKYNITINEHKKNREKVENIENILINDFIKKYGKDKIINKKCNINFINDNINEVEEIKKYIFEKEK